MTDEEIGAVAEAMTEGQFLTLWAAAQMRFGFAGTFFGRGDCERFVEEEADYVPLTDEEWDSVRSSRAWGRYLADYLAERGNEFISESLSEMLDEDSEDSF